MPFNCHSGREFDTQNVFGGLNTVIRENANRLCRGNSDKMTTRRKDMIKILIDAAKTLKAEQKGYDELESELEATVAKVADVAE